MPKKSKKKSASLDEEEDMMVAHEKPIREKKKSKPSVDEDADEEPNMMNINSFFSYQHALNSLIDYLNQTIDDIIAGFTRSDQLLFTHADKKLILNAILEAGFYEFCKLHLQQILPKDKPLSEEVFIETMKEMEGEVDLLGYLLVNTRLVHRTVTFDLYLSMLKGGLFEDIANVHAQIVEEMRAKKQKVNKESIKEIKLDNSNLYI
jgi:hypothetical protein